MSSNDRGSYITEGGGSYFNPDVQVSTEVSNTDAWRTRSAEEINQFYNNLGHWDKVLPKTDYSYSSASKWHGLTYNSGIPVTPNLSRISIRESEIIQASRNDSFAQTIHENLHSLNETLNNSLSSAVSSLNMSNHLSQQPKQQAGPSGISRPEADPCIAGPSGIQLREAEPSRTEPLRVTHQEVRTMKISRQNTAGPPGTSRRKTSSGENLSQNSAASGSSRRRDRYPNSTNGHIGNTYVRPPKSGDEFVPLETLMASSSSSSEYAVRSKRTLSPETTSTLVDREISSATNSFEDRWNPMIHERTSSSPLHRRRPHLGWNPERLAEERYYDMNTPQRRMNVINSYFYNNMEIGMNGNNQNGHDAVAASRFSLRSIISVITLIWMATTSATHRTLLRIEQRGGWIGSICRFLMYYIDQKMVLIAFTAFLAGIWLGGPTFGPSFTTVERLADLSSLVANAVWNILQYIVHIPWYVGNMMIGLFNVFIAYMATLLKTTSNTTTDVKSGGDGQYLRIDQIQESSIDYEKLANAVTDLNLRKILETDMLLHSSNIKSEIDNQYQTNKNELIEIMSKLKVQYGQLLIKEKTIYARIDKFENEIRRLQERTIAWNGKKMKTYLFKVLAIVLNIHLSKDKDKLKQYFTSSSTSLTDLKEKYSTPAEAILDTTLLEIGKEIEKVIEKDLAEPDRLNEMIENMVKTKIELALRVYDADKTGMTDYALESAGGAVLSTRCTDNRLSAVSFSIFGVSLWNLPISPRVVIQPGARPGECWSFQGSTGFLVIQLSESIHITSVSIEHIPKSLAPNGNISSAPKDFTIWGLIEEVDPEPFYLGRFSYDIDGPPIQYFEVESSLHDISFPMIELKIESNHGNVNYTCLYRFRVHGIPAA